MHIVSVVKTLGNRPASLHQVLVPDPTETGFYTQTVSMNAFRTRMAKRLLAYQEKRFLAFGQPQIGNPEFFHYRPFLFIEDFEFYVKSMKACGIDVMELHTLRHADVWAFYKYIGFEHRRNRFVVPAA
jgi:hypothetical protein